MPGHLDIADDADLKKLLTRLVNDIIEAGFYGRLHKYFQSAFDVYKSEINQTPAFWNFIEKAVCEASLLRLARVYDQDHRAVSLLTVLHTIAHHTEFFEDDSVLRRVSERYREDFRPGSHEIDVSLLERDIQLVSHTDPLVKKLVKWRSNLGAHIAASPILKPNQRPSVPLTRDDTFTLVDRAFTIYNRYLSAFEGASYARIVIGEESHEFLFKMLRLGLQKYDEDIERQIAQFENPTSEQGSGSKG